MRKLLLLIPVMAMGAALSEDARLESAVYREVVIGDLKGAIEQYKTVLEASKSRTISARALFHMGQCFEKEGRKTEAQAVYIRLVSQFADQTEYSARATVKLSSSFSARGESLPGPPQLKFPVAGPGNIPPGWFMPVIVKDSGCPAGYSCSVVLVPPDAPIRVIGDFTQGFSASAYRGKTVRLRARVRVDGGDSAQIWLSVDRPKGSGDRVLDRPVQSGDWATSSVTVHVDEDATDLNFGIATAGRGRVSLKDVSLEVAAR